MSLTHDPANKHCACAACAFRTASERPSIRRLIAEGSKIDKLYFGKYIPLRERKLLDKLVRTRAVYDDIRNQLLSESEASIKEKPNLKPRKHQNNRPKDLKGKKSSAIIELVHMVDKGNVLTGPKDISECCSCCVCGSKTHTGHEHAQVRRHRRGHGHKRISETISRTSVRVRQKMEGAKRGVIGRGRSFAQRMSETSAMMRYKIKSARKGNTMSGTSMRIRRRLGEVKRGVQFRAKSIMSEPCTCTFQLGEDMKRRSNEVMRRLRPQVQYGEQIMFQGLLSKKYSKSKPPAAESKKAKKKQGRDKGLRKSYQKIKKSNARLIESIGEGARRVKESQTKIKEHIEAEVKRSIEKMKSAKHKVQKVIKTSIKKSTQELEFPIRKDSIAKFKEKIKTKIQLSDYECQHECVPGECVPEECFKIIKIRRIRKDKKGKSGVEKNIGMTSSMSETGVQVLKREVADTGTSQGGQKLHSRGVAAKKHTETKQKVYTKKKNIITEPRISIEIGTKKRGAEPKTKAANVKESPREKKSVKSMISLPPVSSKQNVGPEIEQTQKKMQEEAATSVVLKTRNRRRVEYQQAGENNETATPHGRKAAKVSSSFSFSIEFRKDKEPKKQVRRQIYVRKKERSFATKTDQESHQGSQAERKYPKRDAQTESHALKRCFCTLKLKGKGYRPKPNKSISITSNTQSQTNKMEDKNVQEHVQTKPIKAREMACITCTHEKCDPKECLKNKRHLGVGTKKDTRSTSSIISKSISTSSKSTSARASQNIKGVQKLIPEHLSKSEQEVGQGEQRQLVRISSSFSFNIEFYKEKATDETKIEPMPEEKTNKVVGKQTKGTHKRKHLRHKHSQVSSLSGKSKYTLTKHSLRRCFCTLKLGQPKGKAKPVYKSTGSSTSQRAIQYSPDVNRDLVSVNRGIATNKQKKYHLLPYECEPGVCVPGDCDPYACLELINKRKINYSSKYSNTDVNRMNARRANTDYRRTRSTSSFTSKSMPNKVKKIQSSTGPVERKRKDKAKVLSQIKTSPSSPTRQVVRIGSSFSFNIEFYKNKFSPSPIVEVPVQRPSQSTTVAVVNKPRLKEQGFQEKKVKKHQKSTTILVKKKNRGSFIAPMKRCFCTLKLQTKERKEKKKIESASIGTFTPVKNAVEPKNVLQTKATKTKQHKNKLELYECEPGVCVPGECDPYECLQRIQKRQLKESSTTTDKAKMRSATSVTQKRLFRSKGALAQSKLKGRKVSTVTQKIKKEPVFFSQEEQKSKRQVVRIGSTFSCNIEFCKDKQVKQHTQSFISRNNSVSETTTASPIKKMKHKVAKTKETSTSHQDTQATISKAHKGAGIRPMLKRCFCTLKLQNNQKKKNNTHTRPPQVIAVSTVTVTETKIKSHKNMFMNELPENFECSRPAEKVRNQNWATALYDYKSSLGLVSSVVFRYKEMQSYFEKNSLKSIRSNKLSNSTLKTFYTKTNEKYAYSENCIICCKDNEKRYLKKRKKIIKYNTTYLNNKKSGIFSEPQANQRVCQLSRQNYYAMNIQIPDRRKRYKLKPYECEPGVCVPGECDPYECQKLLLKRLMKSRMSGTNMRSKSMSSSTAPSTLSSKKLQSRQAKEKVKKVPVGMVFKSLPSRNQKQAVKVGSSFSFNIEFSKDRSVPAKYVASRPTAVSHKPTKPPRKKIKDEGTAGHGMNYRDQDSQSATATMNRGSGMKPMMQRCFCTLKLQKKGKNQRNQRPKVVQRALDRGTTTPPNTTKEFVNSRTMMNTGQNTAAQKTKLLPYECEPLVCVPGECDPYECLERIKRRNKKLKDFGTDVMGYKTSTGSMTGRKQYRTQGKQVKAKLNDKQTKSRGSTETRVEKYQEKPPRQAVRIGSSFSFNVEFFKEHSQSQMTPAQREAPPRPVRTRVHSRGVVKEKVRKKKLQDKGLQDSKLVSHRDSQIGSVTHGKSTMTSSLLKRCFCTAKLHGQRKPKITSSVNSRASQAINKKPFLERCFCVMQKLKGTKQPKKPKIYAQAATETVKEPLLVTKEKKVVTRPYRTARRELEPYECEPGVCIPGECNPYECEKLIKARNLKLQTREAFTDRPRTRSTSSNYSSQTSKARRTQSNFKTTSSTTKPRPTNTVTEVQPARRLSSKNKQVVRIGSTFSFNIEFYKDRSPNTEEVQAAAKAIRYIPPRVEKPKKKDMITEKKGLETTDRGSMGLNDTYYNQESQANKAKMQDRGSGVGPVLKRCFCTLKLQKNRKQALQMSSQGTETMKEIPTLQTRGVGTGKHWKLKPYECEPGICVPYQCDAYECEKLIKKRLLKETAVMTTRREKKLAYKLLPYECEPGVCVPGQCDPYECDKRIQARNMKLRDSGTSTKRHRGKSVSSDIRSTTSSKARKVQHRGRERRKRSQSVSSKPPRQRKYLDTSTRQSVQIGSGFSFDVEFYKDKSNVSAVEPKIRPIKQKARPQKSMSSSANQYLANTRSKKLQYYKAVRDTDSQMLARKMRDTGVSPFLRRCFCTHKLQKSGVIPSNDKIISKAARNQNVYMATLLPYECEPGVCTPGECDPYECQKRIQRRLMRSQISGTERGSRDSSTSSTAGKYKASTCQIPTCIDNQKHQKGTCARTTECAAPRPVSSSSSSSRQAVRLGSSFKFDIEFYKDRGPKPCAPVCREPYRPPKIRTHITKPKNKKTRSRSVTSSDLRLQHNQMQTGSRTESKSTGFGPRLKRCFCTLALHKKRQEQPATRTKSTFRNDDLSDLYAYSRNVGVGTRKKYPFLKPYECEPGVCVPGSCDPYECYERIKHRMRDSGTETVSPSRKYASSITSRDAKYKCANTQCHNARPRKERPTMVNFKESGPKPCKRVCGDNARQAVRIGSNFSFSVEFYKDHPVTKIPKAVYKIKAPEPRPKLHRVSRVSSTQKHYKSRPSYVGKSGYDQKCQADCVKNTTRGTTMGAFLKRCFCTLNLHKNNRPAPVRPSRIETRKEKPPDLNRVAMVQTKDKYIPKNRTYSLKPYECEPNVCIPGECNPYECEERLRRRNLRRHSRRIGTHRRSQVSVGSMASRLIPRTSRRLQSSNRRATCATRPCQVSKVVEEPRFAHLLEEMRTGVKIGSNVCFDIEFYKDKSQSPTYEVPKKTCDEVCTKPIKIRPRGIERKSTFSESRPHGMHIGVGDKCDKRTCEAQASGAIMKDKGAGVNNMLKRCFCTLKLHRNPPKVVTVNRLCIDNVTAFKQMKTPKTNKQIKTFRRNTPKLLLIKKDLSAQDNHQIIKYSKDVDKNNHNKSNDYGREYNTRHVKELKENGNEMTTLFPYMPNKFNKNISKTFLWRNIENDELCLSKINKVPTFSKKTNGQLTKLSLNEHASLKREHEIFNRKKSHFQNIKSFLYKILPVKFSKKRDVSSGSRKITATNTVYSRSKNVKKTVQETLKLSKSDRRPTNVLETPKKTISLKLNEAPRKKKANTNNALSCYQTKKHYSRYQSGDTGQTQSAVARDHGVSTTFPPQNVCCAYCQVLDIRKKPNFRSPYESTKIVQMALSKDHRKSAKIGTDTRIKTHSIGVVTYEPEHKMKVCCPCISKGRKSILSSGDHSPIHGEKDRRNIKNKENNQISQKGVQKDREEGTKVPGKAQDGKKEKPGKRNIPSGDAPNNEQAGKGHKPTNDFPSEKKTQGSFGSCMRCLSSVLEVIKKIQGKETVKSSEPGKGKIGGAKLTVKGKDKDGKAVKRKDKEDGKGKGKGGSEKGKAEAGKGKKGKGKQTAKKKVKIVKPKEPCVCGSAICNKEKKILAKWKGAKRGAKLPPSSYRDTGGSGRRKGPPPCVCGSKTCAAELRRERSRKKEIAEFKKKIRCACEAELRHRQASSKRKVEDLKKRKQDELKMLKEYKEQDERRKKERLKQDKIKEKEIKKFQNSGDAALFAESVLDILKLGFTASCDLLRCTKRAVFNPRRTLSSLKALSTQPSRAATAMGDAVVNSGIGSTVHRVRARCKAMRRVKKLKQKLEGNSVTRYLMYMCSKDAKKRIGKAGAQMRRRREPIDFECSLFMASLRRRPCLAVYYSCPAFYPHCLSMLNLWKQFTDIMLVLVAVAVWSPCVVMMEVCRAAVCCFFCTG